MAELPAISPETTHVLVQGGSFDPPTRVHVESAVSARASWHAGALLLFVPASQSPLKGAGPRATGDQRVAMLRLAIEGVPKAVVSRVEIDRPPPSYTVETLRLLRAAHPWVREWRLLIGSDQAVQFHRWREPREILALAPPLVVVRPPHQSAAEVMRDLEASGAWNHAECEAWRGWISPMGPREGSATQVREALARGERPFGLLAPGVLTFIEARGLYGFSSEGSGGGA